MAALEGVNLQDVRFSCTMEVRGKGTMEVRVKGTVTGDVELRSALLELSILRAWAIHQGSGQSQISINIKWLWGPVILNKLCCLSKSNSIKAIPLLGRGVCDQQGACTTQLKGLRYSTERLVLLS
ncbi:hypothetical protein U1Q18_045673 [Sarracenia purpurea var. burkii]